MTYKMDRPIKWTGPQGPVRGGPKRVVKEEGLRAPPPFPA
jgi:hypothetical protein